jgi:hypothetical protein
MTHNFKKKTTNAVGCPPQTGDIDSNNCPTAIEGVITALDADPYNQGDFENAIDDYLAECLILQCDTDCTTLISEQTFTERPTGFAAAFVACGYVLPVYTNSIGACTNPAVNNQATCELAYEAVLPKIAASATWVADDVKDAINAFITACPTTSCSLGCSPVISHINVATVVTGLGTSFSAQCNPPDPINQPEVSNEGQESESGNETIGGEGNPGGNPGENPGGNTNQGSDLRSFKVSTSLIAMSFGTIVVHFLLAQ